MSISKAKIFLFSCIAFIIGIGAASFLPEKFLQYNIWFFGVTVGLGVATFIIFKTGKICSFFLVFILFFILGIWRYSISLPPPTPDKIWFYNNQNIEFIGVINREPDIRQYNQKITVGVQYILSAEKLSGELLPVTGNVLITTDLYPAYSYGEALKINCSLKNPEPMDEFAYDRYLARHDVYSLCYYPLLRSAEGGATPGKFISLSIYSNILKIKNKLQDVINIGLLEPESSLLQAVILGDRRGLSAELLNNFSRAGVSHIIAISGMHIAIISVIIMQALLALSCSRRWSLVIASGFLIFYITLIGWPASALRAGVMVFMVLLAMQLGRLNKVINSLVLAAGALLLINPKLLRDDVGFQLSFLAVLSIIYLYPMIENFLQKLKIPKLTGIRDIISITLAAQALTLPVIALNFQQVSMVAPLANIMVLPLLPFIMATGMFATLVSLFLVNFAWLFFAPVYFLLHYVIWLAENITKLPPAYWQIDYVWPGWIVLFYVLIFFGINYYYRKNENS